MRHLLTLFILALILLVLPTHANALDFSSMRRAVDVLVPVDPQAREGDTEQDFEASQRLVLSDINDLEAALARDDTKQARASAIALERSLRLLGEIAGFEHPALVESDKRSIVLYRELLATTGMIEQALEKNTTPAPAQQRARPLVENTSDERGNAAPNVIAPPPPPPPIPLSLDDTQIRTSWLTMRLWDLFL